jgi:hypothetical protein
MAGARAASAARKNDQTAHKIAHFGLCGK